jgi:hypothetical protein
MRVTHEWGGRLNEGMVTVNSEITLLALLGLIVRVKFIQSIPHLCL